ncbi:hypothetical protein [Sinorhizobium fredii]|uniref:hypothetical protein n=1 Tax=Rhizobium fredii TaxID=380 RepID=UPI001319D3D2|nr:hypothetical protein [Sinorhizobium fredii]
MRNKYFFRFAAIFTVLFSVFLFDAGIGYISSKNYRALLFGLTWRSVLLLLWWAAIYKAIEFYNLILGRTPNDLRLKILMVSDIIFVHSYILFSMYLFYYHPKVSSVSTGNSRGPLLVKGEYTLLGLQEALSNIGSATCAAITIHFIFLMQVLKTSRSGTSSGETRIAAKGGDR